MSVGVRRRVFGATGFAVVASAALGCAPLVPCPECDNPESVGNIGNPELLEVSGLAASTTLPNVLWAHNDSSDSARLFAVSATGEDLGTYEVDGAQNEDWEDVARAACATGECLYVADIGDNDFTRSSYAVYVVEEPTEVAPGNREIAGVRSDFVYPDGPHDAEVLLVHPITGAITIVTKVEDGPALIYELGPLVPDGMQTAVAVGELDPPKGRAKFTGGSVHPEAHAVLLRTNSRLWHFPMSADQTVAEALTADTCQLELALETQGEAVSWLPDASGFVTIGEGAGAAVNFSACGI